MRHKKYEKSDLMPGTVVEVCYPLYKHYGIVTDTMIDGYPTLISLSQRSGRVREEAWTCVVGQRPVRISEIRGLLPGSRVVSRARSYVNNPALTWNLVTCNCEHFVRIVHGLPPTSDQVRNAITGALVGVAATLVFPKITVARLLLGANFGALARMIQFARD